MKILITGAASGIGYDLAKQLAKKNHTVYITTHTKKQKELVKEKVVKENLSILVFKMDIREKEDRKLIQKLDIDCLISHAGIGNGGSILEMDINLLRDNYETNVFSNFSLIQEFYQKKTREQKKAKIMVTSSLASVIPIPYLGCYTSSKSAITMLTMTIKKELRQLNKNITISLIEPGAYHTGFNQVMINNKSVNTYFDSSLQKMQEKINLKQNKLFNLIEKKSTKSIVKKIVKEVEKTNPKFKIKAPIFQALFSKLYMLLFW